MEIPLKKKAYAQKFRPEWEQREEFKMWLKPVMTDPTKAFCSICHSEIFAKCKSEWPMPKLSDKAKELLVQCSKIPESETSDDIETIIRRSKHFPVAHPVENVRIVKLRERRSEEVLKKNIASTYPLIHERALRLMAEFIVYKREFGSSVEREFYKDMTVPKFINRLLEKRAVSFLGANDRYKLITGHTGKEGWESVGSKDQRPPLLLEECLSYDEIKLSALLYVSGHTECINDGLRRNAGVVKDAGIEKHAVVIGVIGPRFKRVGRMDYEDIVISRQQNVAEKGYGEGEGSRRAYRRLWENFYQIDSFAYDAVSPHVDMNSRSKEKRYQNRFVHLSKDGVIFDNMAYHRRLVIIAETTLLEAEARAAAEGTSAFLNIVGFGLGVWKMSPHQNDVFILSFMERTRALLKSGLLHHVSDVNFAYIHPDKKITAMFEDSSQSENEDCIAKKLFLRCEDHPKGGINVQMLDREPSSALEGEHAGKLLVITYPWDGNAHPGNEFWMGKLWSSGDPAAACSTQVAELHNAHVNHNVRAPHTRIATGHSVTTFQQYVNKTI